MSADMWSFTPYILSVAGGAIGIAASVATVLETFRRARRAKKTKAQKKMKIWQFAAETIQLFGIDAEAIAMEHAYQALEEGNARDFRQWRQIAVAIRELKDHQVKNT